MSILSSSWWIKFHKISRGCKVHNPYQVEKKKRGGRADISLVFHNIQAVLPSGMGTRVAPSAALTVDDDS